MNDLDNLKNEFIQGVWRKVRYLEYKKAEEELIKQRLKKLKRTRLKIILVLLSVLLPSSVFIFVLMGLNMFSIITAGILFLSAGAIYEYIQEISIIRRSLYEN